MEAGGIKYLGCAKVLSQLLKDESKTNQIMNNRITRHILCSLDTYLTVVIYFIIIGISSLIAYLTNQLAFTINHFHVPSLYTKMVQRTLFVLAAVYCYNRSSQSGKWKSHYRKKKSILQITFLLSFALQSLVLLVYGKIPEKREEIGEVIITTILAPVFEELLFRGCLQTIIISRNMGLLATLAYPSIGFSLIHLSNLFQSKPWHELLFQMVLSFFASMSYSFIQIETNSICYPILLHMTHNLLNILFRPIDLPKTLDSFMGLIQCFPYMISVIIALYSRNEKIEYSVCQINSPACYYNCTTL